MLIRLTLLIVMLLSLSVSEAANQAREQLIANELASQNAPNEALWLTDEKGPFFTLKADHGSVQRQGGIILLHDMEGHPDWPEVIAPLRNGLPEKGWPTLSVQLPLLSEASQLTPQDQQRIIDESLTRIAAAVEHFTDTGIYNIVLIGQGLGATAISRFLSADLKKDHAIYIKAFIALRFRVHQQLEEEYQPQALLKLKTNLPILDIIGTQLSPLERQQAQLRKRVAKQSQNANYRQEPLANANNNFRNAESFLLLRINGWLKVNAGGAEVELKNLNNKSPLREK